MDTTYQQKSRKFPLPKWIWHPSKENQLQFTLIKRFTTKKPVHALHIHTALTGAATITLDGQFIAEITEKPDNIASFSQATYAGLAPGDHELRIAISCTHLMPLEEINRYLRDRRVGIAVYVEAEDLWLASDDSWVADDQQVEVVCHLGEEPFGDLDGTPEWFICGGYGDIGTYELSKVDIIQTQRCEVNNINGHIQVNGKGAGEIQLLSPKRDKLELFFHLRKQNDWKQLRSFQLEHKTILQKAPSVTFDLLQEHNARIVAVNNSAIPLKVIWNGAESLAELEQYDGCMTEWFEIGPGETYYTLPQGMRYVQLIVIGIKAVDMSLSLSFQGAHVALKQTGHIKTDVAIIDDVFDVSAHTSKVCHQIGLWDGIKRDRLNWSYDFYLAAKPSFFLWDNYEPLKRSIRELGIGTPYGSWMNGIAEYTLWWIKSICEYYKYTGDRSFVLEMKEVLKKHMQWVLSNVDEETAQLNAEGHILIEWAPLTLEEKQLCLQAICKMVQDDLKQLAVWMPELEINVDWPTFKIDGSAFINPKHALATHVLGILSGYVSQQQAMSFLEHYEVHDPITPISAYQLIECYALYDYHERAFELLKDVWGSMLAQGATTFWEAFTFELGDDFHDRLTTYSAYDSYRISLCHAWSSTPVKWIYETILGIQCLEPGFSSIHFRPTSVGGMQECSGSILTQAGSISVRWHKDEYGHIVSEIDVPDSIDIKQDD